MTVKRFKPKTGLTIDEFFFQTPEKFEYRRQVLGLDSAKLKEKIICLELFQEPCCGAKRETTGLTESIFRVRLVLLNAKLPAESLHLTFHLNEPWGTLTTKRFKPVTGLELEAFGLQVPEKFE